MTRVELPTVDSDNYHVRILYTNLPPGEVILPATQRAIYVERFDEIVCSPADGFGNPMGPYFTTTDGAAWNIVESVD